MLLDPPTALEKVLDAVYLTEPVRFSLAADAFVNVAADGMRRLGALVDPKDGQHSVRGMRVVDDRADQRANRGIDAVDADGRDALLYSGNFGHAFRGPVGLICRFIRCHPKDDHPAERVGEGGHELLKVVWDFTLVIQAWTFGAALRRTTLCH